MNESSFQPDPLLDPLFARAREMRPDTARAELAFETRLLARLRERDVASRSGLGRFAWRLLPFFALVVLALGLVQEETGRSSQEAEQAASLQDPDAADLFATFR